MTAKLNLALKPSSVFTNKQQWKKVVSVRRSPSSQLTSVMTSAAVLSASNPSLTRGHQRHCHVFTLSAGEATFKFDHCIVKGMDMYLSKNNLSYIKYPTETPPLVNIIISASSFAPHKKV